MVKDSPAASTEEGGEDEDDDEAARFGAVDPRHPPFLHFCGPVSSVDAPSMSFVINVQPRTQTFSKGAGTMHFLAQLPEYFRNSLKKPMPTKPGISMAIGGPLLGFEDGKFRVLAQSINFMHRSSVQPGSPEPCKFSNTSRCAEV